MKDQVDNQGNYSPFTRRKPQQNSILFTFSPPSAVSFLEKQFITPVACGVWDDLNKKVLVV